MMAYSTRRMPIVIPILMIVPIVIVMAAAAAAPSSSATAACCIWLNNSVLSFRGHGNDAYIADDCKTQNFQPIILFKFGHEDYGCNIMEGCDGCLISDSEQYSY